MDNESFDLFIQKHKRDINCLLDADRNIRKSALERLNNDIFVNPNKQEVFTLLREFLINHLLKCLEDKIEKIRELTIKMLKKFVNEYDLDDKVFALLNNAIISRLNNVPFPETSEILRLNLIDLLEDILKKSSKDFLAVIPELCSMLSKFLTDQCPEVKIKLSEFLIHLSSEIGKKMGPHTKGISNNLCLNLKHSHNKIRKITIQALGDILLCEGAGKNFEDCVPFLKNLANDKKIDVRTAFYAMIFKLATNFNIVHLRKYEFQLVMFLINGLADEQAEIIASCGKYLEEAGLHRKKLAVELNEEEDINMNIDN